MTDVNAQHLRLLEALLFASASPVPMKVMTERLPEDAEIPALIEELTSHYKDRGVNLVKVGNAWAFRTAPELGQQLTIEREVTRKLSRAAVETLAIVAYHQPITRAEIEEIRGVSISRGTMDILLEMGWIRPKGRRRTPGRPVTWGTSHGFLDHFGLTDIHDLPGLEELKKTGLLRQGQTISDVLRSDDDSDDDDADEDQLMLDDMMTDEMESDWEEDQDFPTEDEDEE